MSGEQFNYVVIKARYDAQTWQGLIPHEIDICAPASIQLQGDIEKITSNFIEEKLKINQKNGCSHRFMGSKIVSVETFSSDFMPDFDIKE